MLRNLHLSPYPEYPDRLIEVLIPTTILFLDARIQYPQLVTSTDNLVKVIFDLPEPDMGVSGEGLWAAPVGENLYELQNSPWHARNVNWLDVVEAISENENEWPKFLKVHRRSGHRTIHLYILSDGQSRRQEILDECNRLGSTYEEADNRMYALDFEPEVDIKPAIEYLERLKEKDLADWRINDY